MSDSRNRPVSIEMLRWDWDVAHEVLQEHGYTRLAETLAAQLPPEAPTKLGAVVMARVNDSPPRVLTLAQPNGDVPWYDPVSELWHEHQEVRLVQVVHPGVEL